MTSEYVVLDYSHYIDYSLEFQGSSPEPHENSLWNSEVDKTQSPVYSIRGWCQYCGVSAKLTYDTGNRDVRPTLEDGILSPRAGVWSARVWECERCGWWEVEGIDKGCHDGIGDETEIYITRGSLRRFDVRSAEIPTSALAEYLVKQPSSIAGVNPKKMEMLVQSVFREHYNCDAIHCGKSHDGGVDLLLIDSDEPCAVQVKRRARASSTESVGVVREFLGACLLKGFKRGILVTSAHDFSSAAKVAAAKAKQLNLMETYELVNGEELSRRLRLISNGRARHWSKFVRQPWSR